MAQRARVAAGLEAQRIGLGNPVAPVELEGNGVERGTMVNGPAAAGSAGCEPMCQLVEQGQPLVELVPARTHRHEAIGSTGDPGRVLIVAAAPRQVRHLDARIRAHDVDEG